MTAQLDSDPRVLQEVLGDDGRTPSTTNSVSRAMSLLNCFGVDRVTMTLTELASATGLSKSTALRMLNTLRAGGLVQRIGGVYTLGPHIDELAAITSDIHRRHQNELRELSMPFLQDLFLVSGHTVHLGLLVGTDVLYVEKLFGHRRVQTPTRVGMRTPAACTALGKAMLAQSDDAVVDTAARTLRPMTRFSLSNPVSFLREIRAVRASGYALDREEAQLGVTCVAAVIGTPGGPPAAVSVTGPVGSFDPPRLAEAVQRTTTNITRALDASRPGLRAVLPTP